MAKKEIEAEIREIQESIKRGKTHLDESLYLIEDLQAQIQAIRQNAETGKKKLDFRLILALLGICRMNLLIHRVFFRPEWQRRFLNPTRFALRPTVAPMRMAWP